MLIPSLNRLIVTLVYSVDTAQLQQSFYFFFFNWNNSPKIMEKFKKYISLFILHIKTPNRGLILFLTLDSIVKEGQSHSVPDNNLTNLYNCLEDQSTNCVEKCMHLRFSMITGIDFNVEQFWLTVVAESNMRSYQMLIRN